jgi:hypothetical protein
MQIHDLQICREYRFVEGEGPLHPHPETGTRAILKHIILLQQ